jgi:hypothetical protein
MSSPSRIPENKQIAEARKKMMGAPIVVRFMLLHDTDRQPLPQRPQSRNAVTRVTGQRCGGAYPFGSP